ncbi:glutathione peroxidase NDAI_0D05060 [Naumovozyma dairenensis CBS 421]|uniref:Glutathione peroxidase n=1 Tax=Naumovozyma dairenensis (strain ATCC 10597 / BCRC 20456 / CBS 421 / NBRC 0211 / NRRL Y-12639) TaxID=1071378 RepID=G0WAK8_NAUDC|nr:hypothetical protein NDAI_0D05060 [Naumovozyma dairenensis CBS 421]CCD24819.1 hypothetical protein NDAI_0D05060 [Naumovozyma dairenensis CBS 421]
MTTFYDLTANLPNDETFHFSDLKGKVVLIVNVASKCSFTPQYKPLEHLYRKYKDKGFTILGFPCNQFAGQEPGSDADIKKFCQETFGVTFPLMKKINVNGSQTDPVYQYLKSQKPGVFGLKTIKWNFEKFLIDKSGNVYERYSSLIRPEELEKEIEKLLGQ